MKIEPGKIAPIQGMEWFKEGWRLFVRAPGIWIMMSAAVLIGILLLSQIPVVGPLLAALLMPSIIAGYLSGCEALQQGKQLQPAHLFAGFREHMPALVILGGANLGVQILLQAAMQSKQVEMIALGLTIGLLMALAMHFAPALILFNRIGVLSALQISLFACLRNILPLLMYVFLMVGPTLLAMVLVVGIVVWLPMVMAGSYAAYRNIFPQVVPKAQP